MSDDRSRGFTLLELLIAITLLGLLMAGLLGGLRLGARAWDVGAERLDRSARLLAVHGFISDRLTHAMPVYALGEQDREAVVFAGGPEQASFVTTLPEQLGPGLHAVSLGLDDERDPLRLVISWRPFRLDEDGRPVATRGGGRRVLLGGLEHLEFAYYGAAEAQGEPIWQETWEEREVLPTLIRLRLHLAGDVRPGFPELIVRPMIDYLTVF